MIKPRTGNDFVLLSSGYATDSRYNQQTVEYHSNYESAIIPEPYRSAHRGGLQTHDSCLSSNAISDTVHLHYKMRAPANVKGFSFDFRFFTAEYPQYVCTRWNDFFLALLTDENGKPLPGVKEDGNISFDEHDNPVSVNNAFFTSCVEIPCDYEGVHNASPSTGGIDYGHREGCPAIMACNNGTQKCNTCRQAEVADVEAYSSNPYIGNKTWNNEYGGGTAWLTTTAPVESGKVFNLDFYIWDTGDSKLDSTVIIDNFQWRCGNTKVSTGFATGGVM